MIRYFIFKTLFGWMGVVGGRKGLKRIILPHAKRAAVKKIIFEEFPGVEENSSHLRLLADILGKYFEGKKFTRGFAFDATGFTDFLVTVWKTTQTIPWGEVRSYQWLSTQIKNPGSFRAVGRALGKNPFPLVVPCHRIIRKDGTLGGFSAPEGILLKQRLLQLEGVRFDSKGRVIGFKKK
ncbi:MAG TPA: methylated-DNA--[protein]-cysteine S-methyltransferase [Thermodesulfobacteriota bacterium]|nr:methylated-DNA--[protein]-cysteine S-methyltransferase [Thermodesulfobacteriota bacterium]